MRVTNSMMVNTLLRNLMKNMDRMNTSQEQLSSGKRINRPSDDPVGVIDSLRLSTGLTELDQFRSNAQDAQSWLEATDGALNESGEIIKKIRDLVVQGASDALPQVSRDAIAKEVNQLREQLIAIGNSTYAGKYIFSGTNTRTAAFDTAAGPTQGDFLGNTNTIQYEIGVGVNLDVNVNGTQAFGDLFTNSPSPPAPPPPNNILDTIINDLNTANTADLANVQLSRLDALYDQQLQIRADVGARVNRIEFAVSRMDTLAVNMTDLLSKAEDVDMAKLITQLKQQENVYNASLSSGARIVQPSLMDFLR